MFDRRVRVLALRLLTLSAVFLTPLLFFTPAHEQFELPKLVFLGLVSSLGLGLALSLHPKPAAGVLEVPLFLFLAAQVLCSLPQTSLSWQASLLGDYENFSGLATLLTYLGCFFVFKSAFQSHQTEKPFYFISLAAFLSSIYAVAQHFGLDFVQWNPTTVISTREFASLGNPNFLSSFLAMAFPLWLAWSKTRTISKPSFPSPLWITALLLGVFFTTLATSRGHTFLGPDLSPWSVDLFGLLGLFCLTLGLARFIFYMGPWSGIPALALLALGIVATGSRGGFMAALLAWLVFLLLSRDKKTTPAPSPLPSPAKILGFLALLLPSLWIGRPFLARFTHSILHMGESLSTSRLEIWGPALKMVEAHPLLGVGLDTFKTAFPYYSGIGFNHIDGMFVSSRTAHNELLQIASTTGLIGLGAYLILWGAFFFLAFRFWRQAAAPQKFLTAGVIACAAAYQTQNFFSFDVAALGVTAFWMLAWVENLNSKPILPEKSFFTSARFVFLSALVLAGLFFPLTRLLADLSFGQGQVISEYLKKPDPDSKPQELLDYSDLGIQANRRAVDLCPLEVKYRLYLGLAYEQRAQLDHDQPRKWLEAALQNYRQALAMSPENGYYYNDEGRVCASLADSDPAYRPLAVEAFQTAVKWAPSSPFFWINLAQAQQADGKPREASLSTQQAFGLDSSYTAKILAQAALLDYQTGKKAGALDKLQAAMNGNTTVAEPYFYRGLMEMDAHLKKQALRDFLEAKKRVDPVNPGMMSNLDDFIRQASPANP